INAALNLQLRTHENWCLPELLRIKARILVHLGKRGDAYLVLAQAKECAESAGARAFEVRILAAMIQMADADQDYDTASALRRSLAEMVDEEDVIREGAEFPEDVLNIVAAAPSEVCRP